MLVLSRKPGEAVQIGDIVVRVIEFKGQAVRIGIEAPREMPVVRTELLSNGKGNGGQSREGLS